MIYKEIINKILKERKHYSWHGTTKVKAADIEMYLNSPYYVTFYEKLEYITDVIEGKGKLKAYLTHKNTNIYIYEDETVIRHTDDDTTTRIANSMFDISYVE